MKPTKNYIKIKPKVEDRTKSGILLSEENKFPMGTIVALGAGLKDFSDYAIGATVAYRDYSAIEIEDFVYLLEEDIIAYEEAK